MDMSVRHRLGFPCVSTSQAVLGGKQAELPDPAALAGSYRSRGSHDTGRWEHADLRRSGHPRRSYPGYRERSPLDRHARDRYVPEPHSMVGMILQALLRVILLHGNLSTLRHHKEVYRCENVIHQIELLKEMLGFLGRESSQSPASRWSARAQGYAQRSHWWSPSQGQAGCKQVGSEAIIPS